MRLASSFNTTYCFYTTLLICSLISACSVQTYKPSPLDLEQKVTEYSERNLQSPELETFLNLHQESLPRPEQPWELSALTHAALFLHPKLNLAKASYRTTQLQLAQGQLKPLPSISTQIARSNRANGDIDPFGLSLSIDLPIQTNDKQAIRVAKLSHLSEIAKLDIARTAWHIRAGVMQSVLSLYQQSREAALLNKEIAVRQKIVQLLSKRVAYGEANNLTLHQAQQGLTQSQHQLQTSQQSLLPIRAKLAQQIGISASATSNISIDYRQFDNAIHVDISDRYSKLNSQRLAVINHLALRKALLQYAVAEQSLKLEYAKQVPDIVLSPGYAFEFGDSVWSLGFNSLMTLLQKNKVGIAKAKQLRSKEVAQFEATQHQVISSVQVALADYQAANAQLASQQTVIEANQAQSARLQKQFDAGLIGRLDLTLNALSSIRMEQVKLSLEHKLLSALLGLEATMQTPVITTNKPFQSIESLSQINQSAL